MNGRDRYVRRIPVTVDGGSPGEASVGYDSADPLTIAALFIGPDYEVQWVIARSLLRRALTALAPAGVGNVTVSRVGDRLRFDLYRRGTHGIAYMSAFEMKAFLDLTDVFCAPGSEQETAALVAQVDRALTEITGGIR